MKHRPLFTMLVALTTALPLVAAQEMASPAAVAAACTVTVRITPGMTDGAVPCVEQRLIELGYGGIVGPDTVYDVPSVQAVQSFQTSRGLYADGIISSITGRQLGLRGHWHPQVRHG